MNLDDLGRDAAQEVRRQAESIRVSVPSFDRKSRWLAPAVASAAVVILATAIGLLIRDQPDPPIITSPATTTTTTIQEATTTPATTIAVGPLLDALPAEPHIQVGLNDATLILSLEGDVIGHVQPPLIGPEFYQFRQRRLTEDASASVNVPEHCLVDSVIEPGNGWWVVCDPEAASGPYLGVLSAGGEVSVRGRLPDPPAGARADGHWGEVFVREDGALLAQFSGECEIPHAMFIIDGVAQHVSGEGFWDEASVPISFAFGWLPDGRALVWTWHEAGCGSADPEAGLYAYAIGGSRQLLLPFSDFPTWARVADSATVGLPGQGWLRASYGHGIFGSDDTKYVADPLLSYVGKTVAWDRGNGFVYLTEQGMLRWWRPDTELDVKQFAATESIGIVDVLDDGGRVVVLDRGGRLIAVDLFTGEERDQPPDLIRLLDSGGLRWTSGGRSVAIEWPDWSNVERGEGGEMLPPFPLPELVVTAPNGPIRFEVGTLEQPFAFLHDFDGRRVIVSIEASEPAAGPRTVYVIDLECRSCTEILRVGYDWFDLVGELRSSGTLEVPDLTGE